MAVLCEPGISCAPIGVIMNEASGVDTIVISPIGVFMTLRRMSGNFVVLSISTSIRPFGVFTDIVAVVRVALMTSCLGGPPAEAVNILPLAAARVTQRAAGGRPLASVVVCQTSSLP